MIIVWGGTGRFGKGIRLELWMGPGKVGSPGHHIMDYKTI